MEQNKDQSGAAVRGEAVAEMKLVPKFCGQFDTHHQWVNKAASWLASPDWRRAICVDTLGRRMAIGADMAKARDEGTFPVRYFWECELVPVTAPVSARAADAPSEPSDDLMQKMLMAMLECTASELSDYSPSLMDSYEGNVRAVYAAIVKSRAADALDSQPTEPDGLPPLPEPIEVGGEGWDFDDFKSEKTFSCEHMWAYARAAIASSQPTDGDGCDECRHTYCLNGEVCRHCGDVNGTQGWKGGRQPTDGGVQS